MLRLAFAAGLAALALAPSALAYPLGETHATLAVAAPPRTEAVIDSRVWRCLGTVCVALPGESDIHRKPVIECRNAARVLGKFTAYASGDAVLTDAQLAECAEGLK